MRNPENHRPPGDPAPTAPGEFTAAQRRGPTEAVGAGAGLIAVHSADVPATEQPPGCHTGRVMTLVAPELHGDTRTSAGEGN